MTSPDPFPATERACEGAETICGNACDNDEMRECKVCGMRVRWDLTEHPFFGFKAACERPCS